MKVTPPDIIKMNELYQQLGSFAGVARATGFSASTVKKYVDADYTPPKEREIQRFEGDLPQIIDVLRFKSEDWSDSCLLSDEEKADIQRLWEELDA